MALTSSLLFTGCEDPAERDAIRAPTNNLASTAIPTNSGDAIPPGIAARSSDSDQALRSSPDAGLTSADPASPDPVFEFMAQIDRAPVERHPKDWEQTKILMARPAPRVGQPAPDFSLPTRDGSEIITRSAYQAGRPLVLILGSFTCPPFRRWSSQLEALFQRHKDHAAFLFVYIHEAHPADGWQVAANEREGVIINRPREWNERQAVAQSCCSNLNLSIPCVVDTIENTVDDLYVGWPERIFVVGRDGMIAYAGKLGPFGFKPEEAESALRQLQ